MLLVSVYAMDFFKLSNIKRPEKKEAPFIISVHLEAAFPFLSFSEAGICNS